MSNSVVMTLVDLGYVCKDAEKAKLSTKSTRDLITDYIFPWVVRVGGQDIRGWRLAPQFMELMTRHAPDFIAADEELGNLLFELAMQRLQRHPVLESIDYVGMLPREYQKYSATWDQPGLWGDEEWEFMRLRLEDGFKLSNPKYREHCKALVLEIAKDVLPWQNSTGWFSLYTEVSGKELWDWVAELSVREIPIDELVAHLLENKSWHQYKKFLQKCLGETEASWEKFFANIDLDKEQYYRGISRWGLKLFGLYAKKTEKRIKEEILNAE